MKNVISNKISESSISYSINNYQRTQKWCFAIVMNKAKDNFDDKPGILNESLIRFEKRQKEDWFDEEIKELILKNKSGDKDKYQVEDKIKDEFGKRLNDLRNYFSHYLHTEKCLFFEKEDVVRIIMEKAYEKSKSFCLKREKKEKVIPFAPIFDESNKITTGGVVLFASFFLEKRFVNRLMGYIKGFKHNEGVYKISRDAISHYALRDSYSVRTPEHNTKMFRDILGYLLRIPSTAYQHYYPDEPDFHKEGDEILNERKTKKFIAFALNYIEDSPPKDYKLRFARKKISKPEERGDDENKPHRKKAKVNITFKGYGDNEPYYINHNNVILEITDNKTDNKTTCKIGVNELKYLALLFLKGRAKDAIVKICNYCKNISTKLNYIDRLKEDETKCLPVFIRRHHGIKRPDEKTAIKNRVEYILKKWNEKKDKSKEMRLDSKARDILRYINECCSRALDVDEYNKIFDYLVNKNFKDGFHKELSELIRTERIEEKKVKDFRSLENLEAIHQKVCEHVLSNLEQLQGDELLEYTGLKEKDGKKDEQTEKEKKDKVFENKVKNLRPVLCRGYLRKRFFDKDKKKFWEHVKDAHNDSGSYDVLIDDKYYQISGLEQFDKVNKALWETKSRDRLCVMIAWEYYKRLNKDLAIKSKKIEWNDKEQITSTFTDANIEKRIRFSIRDFTKLYVMDDLDFLKKLFEYFFDKGTNEIEYHRLYSDGLNKYSNLQKECIKGLLKFEDNIIKRRRLVLEGEKTHFDFRKEILKEWLNGDKEKNSINKVRNSVFHHNISFEKEDLRRFYDVMKQEKIQIERPLKV